MAQHNHEHTESVQKKLVGWLFLETEGVELSALENEFSGEDIPALIQAANEALSPVGLSLYKSETKLQLMAGDTAAEFYQKVHQDTTPKRLSESALEVLATIGYLRGVTKEDLDYLRGVNNYIMLRNLTMQNMVEESRGAYSLTPEALAVFSIRSIQELPDWEDLHTELKRRLSEQDQDMVK